MFYQELPKESKQTLRGHNWHCKRLQVGSADGETEARRPGGGTGACVSNAQCYNLPVLETGLLCIQLISSIS